MSNSPLVVYTKLSPHRAPRTAAIDTITIHHMAGNASIEACAAEFQGKRRASSNYGIGSDGRVGLYVPESDRAVTSSSTKNDNRAVTIEVANDGGDPDWHVSDKALEKTIELCVDICQRNGIAKLNFTGDKSGNMTMHKWFAPTKCPGPYLESKFPYIAEEVNRRLAAAEPDQPDPVAPEDPEVPEDPAAPENPATPEGSEAPEDSVAAEDPEASEDPGTLYCVLVGTFANRGNAQRLLAQLSAAGFTGFIDELNAAEPSEPKPELPAKKSVEEVAREVVWGLWGVGADRRQRLTAAGYDYAAVQTVVDKLMGR